MHFSFLVIFFGFQYKLYSTLLSLIEYITSIAKHESEEANIQKNYHSYERRYQEKAAAKRRKDKKSQRKTLHGNQENPRIQVFQPVFLTRIKS